MGKIIVPNAVNRKKGFLYYIDKNGNICEAKLKRTRLKNKLGEELKGEE